MKKILHIVSALDGGGVERMLLNYFSHMNRDNYKFDFITYGKNGLLEKQFEELGSEIFHIPSFRTSPIQNLILTKRVIANGKYDAVHSHIGVSSIFPIYFSKRLKTDMRITHNHLAYRKESFLRKIIIKLLIHLLKKYSTNWLACGNDAAISFWGKQAVQNGKVQVINNAIEVEKFAYNPDKRAKLRKELGIEDKFVVGNVARFDYQKNHKFMIEIFSLIYQKNKNSILLLVGNGDLEEEIKEQVKQLKLESAVRFLGIRSDVHNLINTMDVFLLPSRFEGLPVVLVETQASGLKSYTSNTITEEVNVTSLLEYISLKKSPNYWANAILKYSKGYVRRETSEEISKAGYDIVKEAKKMELFYGRYKK